MITNRLREVRERRLREASDPSVWTQEGLALRVGISRQTIIAIEKGVYNPSLDLAFKLARAFDLQIEEIFTFESEEGSEEAEA
ncbi:MAG: helix-turn-helix transcriptional regulator [Promethearchaeota archaeon]